MGLLMAGIITTELLLFTQGTFFYAGWGMIPGHYWHLFIASAMMPTGVALLLLHRRALNMTKHTEPD